MVASPKRGQTGSVNWILVTLLGLVLPIAVVAVVGMMVTSTPRLPKANAPALGKSSGTPPASVAAPAEAPKPEPKALAKTEANPPGKAEDKPAAPEKKPETAAAPVTLLAAATDADRGKAVYTTSCAACHAAGVAGAPKLGDKVAWAPRLKEGTATLQRMAIKGIRAMPPRGGNPSLSDADVKAAVDY
ncbi:MAG: c-type cytochrome, partial [Burkholderiales bacterium]